jgi:hypothetical protein
MSTETVETGQTLTTDLNWKAGVVGGIAGGLAMGALIALMNAPTIAVAIPSLYMLAPPPSLPTGFAVHLFHGAVLGVVFAGIAGALDVESPGKIVGLGVAWGVVTWVLLAALLMPVWLGAVGSPASPPFPNFATPSLLWHVVYGVVLGGVYTLSDSWF